VSVVYKFYALEAYCANGGDEPLEYPISLTQSKDFIKVNHYTGLIMLNNGQIHHTSLNLSKINLFGNMSSSVSILTSSSPTKIHTISGAKSENTCRQD